MMAHQEAEPRAKCGADEEAQRQTERLTAPRIPEEAVKNKATISTLFCSEKLVFLQILPLVRRRVSCHAIVSPQSPISLLAKPGGRRCPAVACQIWLQLQSAIMKSALCDTISVHRA